MLYKNRIVMLLCLALVGFAQPSLAQNYPSKPIHLIVGFAPGGPNDIVARVVAQKLSTNVGVPVTVDNKPGADSMIGTQQTAKSAPDGYTISMISASATIHPSVYENIPYEITKDFSPITVIAASPFVLVVNAALPVKSVKELVAYAKGRPGQLNFASSGLGGSLHLAGELFKELAQIDMNHVPYKGGAPAATDVVSGQVQLMFSPIGVVMPFVKTGKLRALAVTSAKRWPTLPDLPTMIESGVAGYEASGWYALVAPAKTPAPIINRLNQEIVRSLTQPDVRQQLANFDLEPVGSTPEEMARHLSVEVVKWEKVSRDAKIVKGTLQ